MTDLLTFKRDGWLNYLPDDSGEGALATRFRIGAGRANVTRNISKRAGGESEAINVSILPLAEYLADAWWTLLYEPLKLPLNRAFQVGHRLDSCMRGYSFPALALFSGGDKSIVADWATLENPHSTISFMTPPPTEPIQLDRQQVENMLMDLVEGVLERLSQSSERRQLLREAWDRIRTSMDDPEEFGYCMVAGRLGVDPYDPEAPDLSQWGEGLSNEIFGDLSEAMELEDLGAAASWVREVEHRLALFPTIELRDFGTPCEDDLDYPAWAAGEASAMALRTNTGFRGEPPRRAVDELFGAAVSPSSVASEKGPPSLTALIRRCDSSAQIATIARSARQRRFKACAATYIAWISMAGKDRASTEAITRRQQASRAFAAEMLAPKDALLSLASRRGFDSDDLESIASELMCPSSTIMWQAHRAGIPLRGVELPFRERMRIVS